jgi:hypothetical protein
MVVASSFLDRCLFEFSVVLHMNFEDRCLLVTPGGVVHDLKLPAYLRVGHTHMCIKETRHRVRESILLYMHSRDLEACDEAARDVFPLLNMQESVDQGSESMFRHLLAWPTRHAIRCGT